jgi:PKD repeat protein
MKIIKVARQLFLALCICFVSFGIQRAYTNASGPPGAYSNAPGESNCTSCHYGGSFNSGTTGITLKVGGSAWTGYIPDSTYTVTVSFSSSGISRWGFQLTAVQNSSGKGEGTFTKVSTGTQVSSRTVGTYGTRQYVEHSTPASTSGSVSWQFKWKAPATNVGDIDFYVVINAANGDGSDLGDNIYGNTITLKPIVNLPVASFTYSPTNPCQGDTVSFFGSATNTPTGFSWTFFNGVPATSKLQNPKVVFKAVTGASATLTATNANGTGSPLKQSINVRARAADTITPATVAPLCNGDSVVLMAGAGDHYKWNTGDTTQNIIVKSTGSFYVTVSNNNGCSITTKTVSVTVNPKPIVTLNRTHGADTLCFGDSLHFVATPGYANYAFYNGFKLVQNSASNELRVKLPQGQRNNYYLIVTNSYGCVSDTLGFYPAIVIIPLSAPSLSAGSSTSSSAEVNWNAVNGASYYEVSEDSGKTWILPSSGATGLSHTVDSLKPGQYINILVRAMSNKGCKTGTQASLLINSMTCSSLTFNASYKASVCPGSADTISFSNFSSSQYGIVSGSNPATKNTRFIFYPTADTTITFLLYDSSRLDCGAVKYTASIKASLPALALTNDKSAYCAGESAQITASAGYDSYSFLRNDTLLLSSAANTVTVLTLKPGDKMRVVGHVRGCSKFSMDSLPVYHKTVAGFSYSHHNGVYTFTDTSRYGTSRTWYFGDSSATDTSANPVHTFQVGREYNVSLVSTNGGGCSDSISVPITISSLEERYTEEDVKVQPVPFKDYIFIWISQKKERLLHLSIYDMQGTLVLEKPAVKVVEGSNQIRLSTETLKPASYILYIEDGESRISKHIIKI